MGIRVNKFLGYGLTDIANRAHQIIDPRIDPAAIDRADRTSIDEYHIWLRDQFPDPTNREAPVLELMHFQDLSLADEERRRRRGLYHCLAYSPEYGLPEVLVIQPLSCTDWSRHDDPIDWMEETYLRQDDEFNHAEVFPHGIWPFSGLYMDKRDGKRLRDAVMEWVRAHSSQSMGEAAPPSRLLMDELARGLGFADDEEAKQYIRPLVPMEVRAVAEFLGLFADPDAWLDLEPMLYTYWS